jgi:hypothetical protein
VTFVWRLIGMVSIMAVRRCDDLLFKARVGFLTC